MSDLFNAAVKVEGKRRHDLIGVFTRQRDHWVVSDPAVADLFAEIVNVLCDAEQTAAGDHVQLEVDFMRVFGLEAGPGGILSEKSSAGDPPDPVGWLSARAACGDPVLSEDATEIPEES